MRPNPRFNSEDRLPIKPPSTGPKHGPGSLEGWRASQASEAAAAAAARTDGEREAGLAGCLANLGLPPSSQVRLPPSWPRSWANFSLL
jgi:hypothetical protein